MERRFKWRVLGCDECSLSARKRWRGEGREGEGRRRKVREEIVRWLLFFMLFGGSDGGADATVGMRNIVDNKV